MSPASVAVQHGGGVPCPTRMAQAARVALTCSASAPRTPLLVACPPPPEWQGLVAGHGVAKTLKKLPACSRVRLGGSGRWLPMCIHSR